MSRTSKAGALTVLVSILAVPLQAQTFTRFTGGTPVVTDISVDYSGATWVDYDGDDDLDLFVNNGYLYRNDLPVGFTSVATTIGSGIALATGMGNTWGDYDNDGDPDVFICGATSRLYRNNGDGSFSAVTSGAIGQGFTNRGWSCAWSDYDMDGDLDLAITHAAGSLPGGPTTNHLLLNIGPPGYSFFQITNTPITTSGLTSYTVGTWSDIDLDGDPDYSIGAGPADGTVQPDYLFRSLHADGVPAFERITTPPLATDPQDGQMWNWVDYDNDGDMDAYVTNWRGATGGMPNRLYRNDGDGFTRLAAGAIVTDAEPSLSSVWGDYDNDGDLDCYVANDDLKQSRFYRNNGDGTFTSVSNATTEFGRHRGASAGDYDDDGDLDLYVDAPFGGRRLYRNEAFGNHWLKLRLAGTVSNRSAIGALVRARATIGGETVRMLREVQAQNTFNGHNALEVHFGLGDAAVAESITIRWPSSGIVETLYGVTADRTLDVVENAVTPAIPNGADIPGQLLLANRDGSDVHVTWDSKSCPATAVNVYQGSIGDFASFTGGHCDLPASGTATLGIPDDRWFLVVATDGLSADGAYGSGLGGQDRNIQGTASVCPAITRHVVAGECF